MMVSFEGIGQWSATFACTDVQEGQVVKISDILLDGPCRIDHQGCQIPVPVTNHTNIPEVE